LCAFSMIRTPAISTIFFCATPGEAFTIHIFAFRANSWFFRFLPNSCSIGDRMPCRLSAF
jgi:hypothetical protein